MKCGEPAGHNHAPRYRLQLFLCELSNAVFAFSLPSSGAEYVEGRGSPGPVVGRRAPNNRAEAPNRQTQVQVNRLRTDI